MQSLSLFGNYYIKFNRDSTDFSYPQSVNGLQNSPHPLYPSDVTPKKHDLLLHVISSHPPLYSKAIVITFCWLYHTLLVVYAFKAFMEAGA